MVKSTTIFYSDIQTSTKCQDQCLLSKPFTNGCPLTVYIYTLLHIDFRGLWVLLTETLCLTSYYSMMRNTYKHQQNVRNNVCYPNHSLIDVPHTVYILYYTLISEENMNNY